MNNTIINQNPKEERSAWERVGLANRQGYDPDCTFIGEIAKNMEKYYDFDNPIYKAYDDEVKRNELLRNEQFKQRLENRRNKYPDEKKHNFKMAMIEHYFNAELEDGFENVVHCYDFQDCIVASFKTAKIIQEKASQNTVLRFDKWGRGEDKSVAYREGTRGLASLVASQGKKEVVIGGFNSHLQRTCPIDDELLMIAVQEFAKKKVLVSNPDKKIQNRIDDMYMKIGLTKTDVLQGKYNPDLAVPTNKPELVANSLTVSEANEEKAKTFEDKKKNKNKPFTLNIPLDDKAEQGFWKMLDSVSSSPNKKPVVVMSEEYDFSAPSLPEKKNDNKVSEAEPRTTRKMRF